MSILLESCDDISTSKFKYDALFLISEYHMTIFNLNVCDVNVSIY